MEGAQNNLETEIGGWDFDRVHTQAIALWDHALGKIAVEGGTGEEKKVFYTALYHTMIDPRTLEDVDGSYPGGDGHRFTGRTRMRARRPLPGERSSADGMSSEVSFPCRPSSTRTS